MTTEILSYDPIETSEEYLGYSRINLKLQRRVITPYTGSTIIYAQADNGEKVVVKLSGINGSLREWKGLNKTHSVGLPVPKPYALVKDMDNQMGVILGYIDGKSLHRQQSDQARYNFGALIHKMHRLTSIDGNEWTAAQKQNPDYFQKNLSVWKSDQTKGLPNWNKSQTILSFLAAQALQHCQTVAPVFNHNDLHDGQAIVTQKNLSIIDFDKWMEDSPLNDIAIYIFHSIRIGQSPKIFETFLKGYIEKASFTELEKSALMFYLLFISSRALIHFYQQGDSYVETAKNTHRKLLEYVESENIWKNF